MHGNSGKLVLALSLIFFGQDGLSKAQSADEPYSPYVGQEFPQNLYWGDTHVHTNLSADAYGFGNVLTPEQAYAFAKGETVTSNSGQPMKLGRPLDFLVITDHAEYFGLSSLLDDDADLLKNSEIGQRWLSLLKEGNRRQILMDTQEITSGNAIYSHDETLNVTMWDKVASAADKNYEPGKFTAFIGFEWTSLPDGNNLHRNIIFRDGKSKAKSVVPFSALDSTNPEDLWRYLQGYEAQTGGKVMAIPHNANVSNGLMFSDKTFSGEPLTTAYAEVRARWEPVVEVTQIKGDGEAHPYLSPDDEFADFERWDYGNFALPTVPKEESMLQYEYARSALKLGLKFEKELGANPFKFGMIGSSDSHIAASAVEENNFFGKFGADEPSPERAHGETGAAARYVASGYAAVWAQENTRESIFDAMQRREIYATTGPRITVRFFGGWTFEDLDDRRPDYAAIGYTKGVPMGGDLTQAPVGAAPRFMVVAAKDPEGANLDRVQIVKGWLDAEGNSHEKVFDVALSDGRTVDAQTGKTTPLESTVNVETATYTNTTGAVQLSAVWEDPEFDPSERAFYYVRVLEIPTPRWSTYDAAFFGTDTPDGYPKIIQERAYTSPIWFTP